MPEILEPGFNPGGLQDKPDPRDFQYAPTASVPFDWNAGFDIEQKLGFKLPVKDQNGSFSCGGQAWASYSEVLEALADGSLEERSAKFIYAQTFAPGGGSWGRDNCNVLVKQGCCREAVLPSYPATEDNLTRSADITGSVREDASGNKELSYWNVPTDIDTVAQAIRDGYGVILLVQGANNGTWTTAFPQVSPMEWRHWIYAGKAKTVNGKKYIGFLNSWGPTVGESGWQWLGEEWFTSGNVVQVWVMLFDVNSAPKFTHTFASNLYFGQTNDEVKALQTALTLDGETVSQTGYYGPLTSAAVLAFQNKYNVGTSFERKFLAGRLCGPKTRATLNSLFQRSQPQPTT